MPVACRAVHFGGIEMTAVVILLCIYCLSAIITGSIHWAMYHDDVKRNRDIPQADKVMKLYVVPFCPIVNSLVALGIITDYLGM
jgi:uncharacterized membrane protein affecting hemolysin expression